MAPKDITPTKDRAVFFSKVQNLRIARVPQVEEPRGAGNIVRETVPRLGCDFEDGYYVVDEEERKRHARYFEQNPDVEESTSTRADTGPEGRCSVEEFLRKHQLIDIEGRGFVELDPVEPDAGPTLAAITDAVLDGDTERLLDIYEQEEKGWKRQQVLDSAKQSLARLEEREAAAAS